MNNNSFGKERDEGRGDCHAGRGPVLTDAAGREVDVNVVGLNQVAIVLGQLELEDEIAKVGDEQQDLTWGP